MHRLGRRVRIPSQVFGLLRIGAMGIVCFAFIPEIGAQQTPVGVCVDERGCGPASVGDASDSAAVRAARLAAAERERGQERAREAQGEAAFVAGEAAFKQGDYRTAAKFFRSAMQYARNNVLYKKRRAAALLALQQAGGSGIAFDDLAAAALDGKAATEAGDNASLAARRKFDDGGSKAPARPPDDTPSVSDALARSLEIPLNLKDPANIAVKIAMGEVEAMLKFNRNAIKSEGQIPPDPAALQKKVEELNATLPKGTPPMTVEKAEAVYNKYSLDLKVSEQKQADPNADPKAVKK
jgi:hypothetical protein